MVIVHLEWLDARMPPGYLHSPGWMAPILSENRMVFLDGCETELFGVGVDRPGRGCAELSTHREVHRRVVGAGASQTERLFLASFSSRSAAAPTRAISLTEIPDPPLLPGAPRRAANSSLTIPRRFRNRRTKPATSTTSPTRPTTFGKNPMGSP